MNFTIINNLFVYKHSILQIIIVILYDNFDLIANDKNIYAAIGNSGNADKQMNELVEKNLEMLDAAETALLKNSGGGMYILFLLPVLTSSFKLIIDMVFMMLQFIEIPML